MPGSPGNVTDVFLHTENQGYKTPIRTFCGTFMASLNAPGFSISLLNLTHVAKAFDSVSSQASISSVSPNLATKSKEVASITTKTLLELIDAPHASAAWPGGNIYPLPEHLERRKMSERFIDEPDHPGPQVNGKEQQGDKDEPKIFGEYIAVYLCELR